MDPIQSYIPILGGIELAASRLDPISSVEDGIPALEAALEDLRQNLDNDEDFVYAPAGWYSSPPDS